MSFGSVLESIRLDVRHAVRLMRRAPLFGAVATLSLALGIGANTAIFGIINGLLLKSLPVHEPDRLFQVLAGEESNFHVSAMAVSARAGRRRRPRPGRVVRHALRSG